jgi:hypothetical protein
VPRYNPNNRAHRKALAKRLTKMLLSSGFTVDTSASGETVFERPVDGVSARVRVLTSIVNGECRQKGADAIRVCAVLDSNGETRGLVKSTRVNRTGDQDGITGRVLAAMRKTYSLARKRANDPSFLALPAKPAKPAPKPARKAPAKRASKRPSAKRINDAVKAAPKKAVSKPAFKVGMLVKSSPTMGSRTQPDATPLRGMVKAIDQGSIHVFWFHAGRTMVHPASQIRPLVAE